MTHTHRLIGMIASPNTHSLSLKAKVYRLLKAIHASYKDDVFGFISFFPLLSTEVGLCIFAKANFLALTPRYPSL